MVFTAFGFLVGSGGFGVLPMEYDRDAVHLIATLALILILFTDASRIDLRLLWKEHDIPVRLLAVGLPLTIAAGAAAALVVFDSLSLLEALLLALVLAPTDAALGQAVVCSPGVPARIRQALNIESGLNDGIVLPFLLITLAVGTSVAGTVQAPGEWLLFGAKQIGLGPLAGIVVGYVGARLLQKGYQAGWVSEVFLRLSGLGLALLAYGIAESVGGNGFIASFAAGLMMGNSAREICPTLHQFGDAEGQLLALLTFMVFGGLLLPEVLTSLDGATIAYAVLSLTLIRILPVSVGLVGLGLRKETHLFLGWFGPRGIASILYLLLLVETSDLPGLEVIRAAVVCTVLLSIFLHGLTAHPAADAFGNRMEKAGAHMPEHESVPEMPLRITPSARM